MSSSSELGACDAEKPASAPRSKRQPRLSITPGQQMCDDESDLLQRIPFPKSQNERLEPIRPYLPSRRCDLPIDYVRYPRCQMDRPLGSDEGGQIVHHRTAGSGRFLDHFFDGLACSEQVPCPAGPHGSYRRPRRRRLIRRRSHISGQSVDPTMFIDGMQERRAKFPELDFSHPVDQPQAFDRRRPNAGQFPQCGIVEDQVCGHRWFLDRRSSRSLNNG
jgi:hypothetical protein